MTTCSPKVLSGNACAQPVTQWDLPQSFSLNSQCAEPCRLQTLAFLELSDMSVDSGPKFFQNPLLSGNGSHNGIWKYGSGLRLLLSRFKKLELASLFHERKSITVFYNAFLSLISLVDSHSFSDLQVYDQYTVFFMTDHSISIAAKVNIVDTLPFSVRTECLGWGRGS